MKRVHITGAPRSGTTLMLEMMATGFSFDAFVSREVDILTPPARNVGTLLTKQPGGTATVGPLLRADPDQWFIFMLRDPRDVVTSVHRQDPDRYWTHLGQWRRRFADTRPHWQHPRLVVVRFEDLVRDPEGVQSRVARRLPFLAVRGPFSTFHARSHGADERALSGLRAPDTAAIGKWRRHKPRLAGQLQLHGPITDDLVALRYEPGARWERELDGVEPDLRPGHWPDFPDPAELRRSEEHRHRRMAAYLRAREL